MRTVELQKEDKVLQLEEVNEILAQQTYEAGVTSWNVIKTSGEDTEEFEIDDDLDLEIENGIVLLFGNAGEEILFAFVIDQLQDVKTVNFDSGISIMLELKDSTMIIEPII